MATVIDRPPPTGEGLTFEKVWAMFQETDRKMQETDRQMKENERKSKEDWERLREQMKETERLIKRNGEQIGGLHNSFGELVEHLVLPKIEDKFNKLGFAFTRTSPNVKIRNLENPDESFEIDVFLENGDIAIAVEVKSKPNDEDVKEHIDRMEKLRRYADKRQDLRRFQGAIAGAVVSDSIRKYILKNGFYLIEQTGDTVKITIPKGFVPKEW